MREYLIYYISYIYIFYNVIFYMRIIVPLLFGYYY